MKTLHKNMGTIDGKAYFAKAVSNENKMLIKLTTGASISGWTQTVSLSMTRQLTTDQHCKNVFPYSLSLQVSVS